MSEVTKQVVIEALNQVEDPELMMGIVDIGLVYEVNVDEENNVAMTYSLTSMGCPAGPHIASEIERAIKLTKAGAWDDLFTPVPEVERAGMVRGFAKRHAKPNA